MDTEPSPSSLEDKSCIKENIKKEIKNEDEQATGQITTAEHQNQNNTSSSSLEDKSCIKENIKKEIINEDGEATGQITTAEHQNQNNTSSSSLEDKNCIKENIKKEIINEDEQATGQITTAEHQNQNNTNNFDIPGIPEDYKDTYQAYIDQVKTLASIPITESVTTEYIKNFKPYYLRYYEDKYCIKFGLSEARYNDVLIRIHSNKLFLVSLASGNDIIRCGKDITGINFMINNNDRSRVRLGGKKKRGAKVIEPHTILCQVKCEGIAKMFNIRAGIPGRIIEINELVKKDPNLLRKDPRGYGFLAIVAPKGHPSQYENVMNELKLLSEDDYFKYLQERTPKFSQLSEEIILKYQQ